MAVRQNSKIISLGPLISLFWKELYSGWKWDNSSQKSAWFGVKNCIHTPKENLPSLLELAGGVYSTSIHSKVTSIILSTLKSHFIKHTMYPWGISVPSSKNSRSAPSLADWLFQGKYGKGYVLLTQQKFRIYLLNTIKFLQGTEVMTPTPRAHEAINIL